MIDDRYLWERSGPPDAQIERLERDLAPLRYADRAPEPVIASPWRRAAAFAAAAAVVLAASVVATVLVRGGTFAGKTGPWTGPGGAEARGAWPIAGMTGPVRIDDGSADRAEQLGVGQWLETGDGGRVEVTVVDIGSVTVHAGSRLRVRASTPGEQRLELARGHIEAMIIAPPRLFFVDTPSATAIDLGCAYELVVDEAGNGYLTVTMGRVELERGSRVSRVPEGAECKTRAGIGPGTPYFVDASDRLVEALERIDFAVPDAESIETVVAESRPYDTLTLWHLLRRLDRPERPAVLDRLIELSPPPAEVDLAALRRGDDTAMEQWWRDLERAW